MPFERPTCLGIFVLALAASQSHAGADRKGAESLAAKIDAHLAARWKAEKIEPADSADDAEFLRRVYLDLSGRIPPVAEIRRFLADPSPQKRAAVVDRLLDGPEYVRHFTHVWRSLLLPEADVNARVRVLAPSFEAWLRQQLVDNRGYDEMAREIISGSLNPPPREAFSLYAATQAPTPIAFYVAKEGKPENLAAGTARFFLGLRLDCAQCHDHPTSVWKRDQFWQYAAFFSGARPVMGMPGRLEEKAGRPELMIPETKRTVSATFLDARSTPPSISESPRRALADWMTAGDNPYFARAAANRLWGHFFGTGLVHPVDDFDANNPPSHPALLDDLARAFVEHEYNLKFLIRALTATRAYQLSSRQHTRPSTPVSPHVFAVMAVRSLSAEQLYDSLAQAVGIRPEADEMEPEFVRVLSPRAEFLEKFGGRNTEGGDQQTTILQALTLMNGQLLAGATNPHEGKTLQAVADFPLSTPERLEWLYLSTLSRPPRANETAKFVVYIDEQTKKAPAAHRALAYRQALADVFWVLLNSSEFFFNH